MKRASTLAGLLVLGLVVGSAGAVDFYNIATLDTGGNGLAIGGKPGSVAFNGTDVYIGTLFTEAYVVRIGSPFGSPSLVGTFGAGPAAGTTNGFVSLDVYGNVVAAATNNGGGDPDYAQAFDLEGNPYFMTDSAALAYPPGAADRIDGIAVDPGWIAGGGAGSGVMLTGYGYGKRNLYDPFDVTAGLPALIDDTAGLYDPPTATGFRDVSFDQATGDIYLRTLNGVARGKRVGAHNFARLDGTTAGVEAIAYNPDGFNSAINVAFVPDFNGDGVNFVIMNHRSSADTFADQVLIYDADTAMTPLAANFFNDDGSPFMAADSESGIYDFSYDAGTGVLAVSDWSNDKVYFFVPEPATLVLALLGLSVLRRR